MANFVHWTSKFFFIEWDWRQWGGALAPSCTQQTVNKLILAILLLHGKHKSLHHTLLIFWAFFPGPLVQNKASAQAFASWQRAKQSFNLPQCRSASHRGESSLWHSWHSVKSHFLKGPSTRTSCLYNTLRRLPRTNVLRRTEAVSNCSGAPEILIHAELQ